MTTTQDIRPLVDAVIAGTKAGRIVETFTRYYAEDIVMSENGEAPRVGKAENLAYETYFEENFELVDAEVGRVAVDGNVAAVEWTFGVRPRAGGDVSTRRQVALQTWRDGQVVQETFYYKEG